MMNGKSLISRRRLLRSVCAALLVGNAGCLGEDGDETGDDRDEEDTVTVIALRAREVPENATVVNCDDERVRRNETVAETVDEAVEDGDVADNSVTVERAEDVIPDDLPFHEGSVYVECGGTVFELQSETLD